MAMPEKISPRIRKVSVKFERMKVIIVLMGRGGSMCHEVNVRSYSNSVQTLASQRNDAECQKATFALQQIFLFDHLVGTAGHAKTVLFPKLVHVLEQPANKFFIPNIAVTGRLAIVCLIQNVRLSNGNQLKGGTFDVAFQST